MRFLLKIGTLISLAFTGLGIEASAAPVGVEEAAGKAVAFMRGGSAGMQKAAALRPSLVYTSTGKSDSTPLFYIFNFGDNGGYAIVSADDRAQTVLGFSDSGCFDPDCIPENMKWWLSTYETQLSGLKSMPEKPAPARIETNRHAIQPLLTTNWNQLAPYNNDCPWDNEHNTRTVTGCVATAMAQVMNYHKWPEVCHGSRNDVNFEGVRLDWDNMISNYDAQKYNDTQAKAVAQLMRFCGASVDMDYSATGSGAQSNAVQPALMDYFGYDGNVRLWLKDYFTEAEWSDMVYTELAAGRPVYYSGASAHGGHAFVCDGYRGNGYFHFNWGWAGYQDGYFLLYGLDPASGGTGSFEGGYNLQQQILTGVQKPTGDRHERQANILSQGELVFIPAESSWLIVAFDQNYEEEGLCYNPQAYTCVYELGICIKGAGSGGSDRVVAFDETLELEPWYGFRSYSVEMPDDLPDGDFTIYPVCRGQGNETWEKILVPRGTRKTGILHVKNHVWTVENPVVATSASLMLNSLDWSEKSVRSGVHPHSVKAVISNVGGSDYNGSVMLEMLPPDGNTDGIKRLTNDEVSIPANSSVEIMFSDILKTVQGNYTVTLSDMGSRLTVGDPLTVKFTRNNWTGALRTTNDYAVLMLDDFIQSGSKVNTFVKLNCPNEGITGVLSCELLKTDGSSIKNLAESGRMTFTDQKLDFEFDIPVLNPGEYYIKIAVNGDKGTTMLCPPWPVKIVSGVKEFLADGFKIRYIVEDADANIVRILPSDFTGTVTIPDKIVDSADQKEYDNIVLAGDAFTFAGSLESVSLPASVASLGNGAFYNASSLTSLNLRGTVPPSITNHSFRKENISKIVISVPDGYANIYKHSDSAWSSFYFPSWTVTVDPETVTDVNGFVYKNNTEEIYSPYYVNPGERPYITFNVIDNYIQRVKVYTYDGAVNEEVYAAHGYTLPALTSKGHGDISLFGTSAESVVGVEADTDAIADVYSLSGILLIKNSTPEQRKQLDAGYYVINKRKVRLN